MSSWSFRVLTRPGDALPVLVRLGKVPRGERRGGGGGERGEIERKREREGGGEGRRREMVYILYIMMFQL